MIRILTVAALIATPVAAVSAQSMSASTYVMKAGASDTYEKQSSQLLLGSTHNARLRQFANQMIHDHTQSTNEVKAAAMRAHMHPAPPALDAQGRRNMAALRAAHGTARDNLYIRQQKMGHQQALALHQGYAAHGSVQPLRSAAAQIVPVVQHHIDELQRM